MAKTTCKIKSEFRILVSFLPAYQNGRESYNFYSNLKLPSHRSLNKLIQNIIYGKCKDKYSRAIVYNNFTKKELHAYLPGYGKVSYEDYKLLYYGSQQKQHEAILKAYVIFKEDLAYQYIEQGKKATATISNLPTDKNELEALTSLVKILLNSSYRNTYKKTLIYWQLTNRVVAELDSLGIVTFKQKEFQQLIQKQGAKSKAQSSSLLYRLTNK